MLCYLKKRADGCRVFITSSFAPVRGPACQNPYVTGYHDDLGPHYSICHCQMTGGGAGYLRGVGGSFNEAKRQIKSATGDHRVAESLRDWTMNEGISLAE